MEQILAAFGIDGRLIVIQIVNFGLLAGILWYFLYTPVLKMIKERQEKVAKGVNDAEEAAKSLETANEEKAAIVTEAHKLAEEINMNAKLAAEEKGSQIINDSSLKASTLIKNAEKDAELAQAKAVKESEAEIAKLAILAAEKVLVEKQ